MTRRVFYSFHYEPDNWRASKVRNIGVIEGNRPATDNKWEEIRGNFAAIRDWIDGQMKGRSCTVVLIGTNTAKQPWIKYEIIKSWHDGMGLVGIHIHGLKDSNERTSRKGKNPFNLMVQGKNLSRIVQDYDPPGVDSKARYNWIATHLEDAVEEAIQIRQSYPRNPDQPSVGQMWDHYYAGLRPLVK